MEQPQLHHWYAIRVKSNRERVTADALRGRDLEVCLPVYRPDGSEGGSRGAVPLFAGYVFSRFDVQNRLPVLTVPSVVNIVSLGNVPQPIEPEEMDSIFSLIRTRVRMTPCPPPPVGNRVEIHSGPLRGVHGTVMAHKGQTRLVVSVSLLQRAVSVDVDARWIERDLIDA